MINCMIKDSPYYNPLERFNKHIWKANQEIMLAFAELAEDNSSGLTFRNDHPELVESLINTYKYGAKQAKELLNNTIDYLENSYTTIPVQYQNGVQYCAVQSFEQD